MPRYACPEGRSATHARSALLAAFAFLAFVVTHAARGEPPPGGPARTDRYGDPLPAGVVARLGTERLFLHNTCCLTFAPDGRRLAAHDSDENLRVWETVSGKELLRLKTPSLQGYSTGMAPLAFSPDGQSVALGCGDKTVRVWQVATGKELHRLESLPAKMVRVVFSPDGRSLFASGFAGPVVCWNLAGNGLARTIGERRSIASLGVSRDGKTLTAETLDAHNWRKRTFVRWEVATGKELGRHSLTHEGRGAAGLAPSGGTFAVPHADGQRITLLDPLTGRERAQVRESDYTCRLAFSVDGKALTCSFQDGTVRVWDVATGKRRASFQALSTSISELALSPDGKVLAVSGRADDSVHLWEVTTGQEKPSVVGHRGRRLALAFLGDGKEIVTVNSDSYHSTQVTEWADWSFRRWDAATGAELAVTRANPRGEVLLTTFSVAARRLAIVTQDGTLRLWDVEAGRELRRWQTPTWPVPGSLPAISAPAFSPDGQTLLAAEGATIHRWKVATGEKLPAFKVEEMPRLDTWCVPSPDGRTLAVWGRGVRQVVLLDAVTGKVRHRLERREGPEQATFSPDGRTIAVWADDGISLWEVATGRLRGRLAARGTPAFSPQGRLLAVGSPLSPVSLWDLASGTVVGRLRAAPTYRVVSFSPDGSRLLLLADESPAPLVCDVAALCGKKTMEEIVKSTEPTAAELEGLWGDLTGRDGERAYRAIQRMGTAGPRLAAFVSGRLKSVPAADQRRIAPLIADLDSDNFRTREKAAMELERLGPEAAPALRRTLEKPASPEVRRRIAHLLDLLGSPGEAAPSPELIRLRVVEALEANGTTEARRLLAEWADGPAETLLAQEAKASLKRLSRRPVARP